MPGGPEYSEDEWIVLYYYFLTTQEATQTDSHPDLQQFAADFGRTAGSLDASMRNIKAHVIGPGFSHGAQTMRSVVDRYKNNRRQLKIDARAAFARINPRAVLP